MRLMELVYVNRRFGQVIPGSVQPQAALLGLLGRSRRIRRQCDAGFRHFPEVPLTWRLQRRIPVHPQRLSGVRLHQVGTVWFTMRDYPLCAGVENLEIRNKTMALVKDELGAVGIEVNIDQIPGQAFFGRYGPLVQGAFDLGEYADIGSQDSGVGVVTKFGSKFIPDQANNFSGSNFSRYHNATADQAISAEIGTLVPGLRQSSMHTLQLLLADDLPALPLFFRPNVTAASDRLVNWKPEYNSNGYTWNVWEWDLRQ